MLASHTCYRNNRFPISRCFIVKKDIATRGKRDVIENGTRFYSESTAENCANVCHFNGHHKLRYIDEATAYIYSKHKEITTLPSKMLLKIGLADAFRI